MDKTSFLARANDSHSFISESKILSQLANMGKAVIICMDELQYFSEFFLEIKDVIDKVKKSNFYCIKLNNNGKCDIENLGSRQYCETAIVNLVESKFKAYKGYCFVVDSGMQYLYLDGKMDESVASCLEKTKSMQKQLEILSPVSSIREVFAHFKVTCNYTKIYYDMCFNEKQKVKKEIKEQELRNMLLRYLKKKMQGDVSVEFCTDYVNDEESVDIYVNDGNERAIIEVKFSLPEKYYEGSTHYSVTSRVGDGIRQLDKYARHLAKDSRLVDYGYVYMFYISDMKQETVKKHIDDKTKKILNEVSNDLHSIFSGVEINDMMCWGTEC